MNPIIFSYHLKVFNEISVINGLFENGLERFHFRKPEMNFDEYKSFIKTIPEEYHKRIIIHSHFDLLKEFNLLGYYISPKERAKGIVPDGKHSVSTFCSTFNELESMNDSYDYALIGPVFKSITVKEQEGAFNHEYLRDQFKIRKFKTNVLAIGGIKEDTTEIAINYGFNGVAILGAIWAVYMETFDVARAVQKYTSIRNISLVMRN